LDKLDDGRSRTPRPSSLRVLEDRLTDKPGVDYVELRRMEMENKLLYEGMTGEDCYKIYLERQEDMWKENRKV
jgi:hypothetical protein